jgi:hypothetical protein
VEILLLLLNNICPTTCSLLVLLLTRRQKQKSACVWRSIFMANMQKKRVLVLSKSPACSAFSEWLLMLPFFRHHRSLCQCACFWCMLGAQYKSDDRQLTFAASITVLVGAHTHCCHAYIASPKHDSSTNLIVFWVDVFSQSENLLEEFSPAFKYM